MPKYRLVTQWLECFADNEEVVSSILTLPTMKTYDNKEISSIDWTKFKIIVPREEDKQEIMDAMKYFHDSDIDTNFVTVNQLAHEYLEGTNVLVAPVLFKKLCEE